MNVGLISKVIVESKTHAAYRKTGPAFDTWSGYKIGGRTVVVLASFSERFR